LIVFSQEETHSPRLKFPSNQVVTLEHFHQRFARSYKNINFVLADKKANAGPAAVIFLPWLLLPLSLRPYWNQI